MILAILIYRRRDHNKPWSRHHAVITPEVSSDLWSQVLSWSWSMITPEITPLFLLGYYFHALNSRFVYSRERPPLRSWFICISVFWCPPPPSPRLEILRFSPYIYQTQETSGYQYITKHRKYQKSAINTPGKTRGAAENFWRNSRCLENRWNHGK